MAGCGVNEKVRTACGELSFPCTSYGLSSVFGFSVSGEALLYAFHLLARVLPASVRPQPQVGLLVDFLFEASHEEVGKLVVGVLGHAAREAFESAHVVAAAGPRDVQKVCGGAHL